jgi:DNA helicase HerA-like ATPase
MATSNTQTADTDERVFIGKGEQSAWLTLGLANRHGLVTGATGTGKTVSLQVMAEGFARAGVPVFAADIKGDLSGICEVGEPRDFILKRAGGRVVEQQVRFVEEEYQLGFRGRRPPAVPRTVLLRR